MKRSNKHSIIHLKETDANTMAFKAWDGNLMFSGALGHSNEDVCFWHSHQRANPALLSDSLMLIIPQGECAPQQLKRGHWLLWQTACLWLGQLWVTGEFQLTSCPSASLWNPIYRKTWTMSSIQTIFCKLWSYLLLICTIGLMPRLQHAWKMSCLMTCRA